MSLGTGFTVTSGVVGVSVPCHREGSHCRVRKKKVIAKEKQKGGESFLAMPVLLVTAVCGNHSVPADGRDPFHKVPFLPQPLQLHLSQAVKSCIQIYNLVFLSKIYNLGYSVFPTGE